MSKMRNPFNDLYVTESVSDEDFTRIFSPVLIDDSETHSIFQSENVLLVGSNGCGKTALLNLLKPELLLAYMNTNTPWPLPEHCNKFISAGIHLSKSAITSFGQRRIDPDHPDDPIIHSLFFGDFLNYWLVEDLLQTLKIFSEPSNRKAADFLGLKYSSKDLDELAEHVSMLDCWMGGLSPVQTLDELLKSLTDRITAYRSFLNFNTTELDKKIRGSKTSVGEPIGALAGALRKRKLIPQDLPVIIRIDQFDQLIGLESLGGSNSLGEFRKIIFKMMSSRDERLSFRIGARPYSVLPKLEIQNSKSQIEELRNYKRVDIDKILSRGEHKSGLFPKFANDVFKRRMLANDYKVKNRSKSVIRDTFGGRLLPADRVKFYVKNGVSGIVRPRNNWPEGADKFLKSLAKENPISAKLGEAWINQQLSRKNGSADTYDTTPWEKRKWWKKERIEQALLQIAARRGQRMVWSGDKDILSLSGSNILVFLSICQLIWVEYLRSEPAETDRPSIENRIVQDTGIFEASRTWFRQIANEENDGDDRYRFVEFIGNEFRDRLRSDWRMSYPGANGFTLPIRTLNENKDIKDFLNNCTAYNALVVRRHTPKTKSRGRSRKWYLSPILSPYFQVPVAHTKEPIYINEKTIREWLASSDVWMRNYGGVDDESDLEISSSQLDLI